MAVQDAWYATGCLPHGRQQAREVVRQKPDAQAIAIDLATLVDQSKASTNADLPIPNNRVQGWVALAQQPLKDSEHLRLALWSRRIPTSEEHLTH
jgi:hypothetical protein